MWTFSCFCRGKLGIFSMLQSLSEKCRKVGLFFCENAENSSFSTGFQFFKQLHKITILHISVHLKIIQPVSKTGFLEHLFLTIKGYLVLKCAEFNFLQTCIHGSVEMLLFLTKYRKTPFLVPSANLYVIFFEYRTGYQL